MTATMPRPTDPTREERYARFQIRNAAERRISSDELGGTLENIIEDLRDINDELKKLMGARNVPHAIQPLMSQGIRNCGWSADHLSNALLILKANAMQAGEA
jgi:hypothetical protein